jgi:protein tyrosine/serine phosphatase
MRAWLLIALLSLARLAQAEPGADDVRRRALAELQGPRGPVRFAVVREGLYRGGQPTPHQIELLHDLGVQTVIDLRHGSTDAEAAAAKRLGMHFVRFPFYGPFGAGSQFLKGIVEAIRSGGNVYVHCHVGRDRTSLVVALYRVLVDKWDPAEAWQKEAVAYGYVRGLWYGKIQDSYDAAVKALVPSRDEAPR